MTDPSWTRAEHVTSAAGNLLLISDDDDDDDEDEADYDDFDDDDPTPSMSREGWSSRPGFGSPEWWSRT